MSAKTGVNEGIASLAANIRAIGLLQNLQLRQIEKGKYEVLAGARRHAALKLLVKQKAFDKDSEIACSVIDHTDGKEISLAENEMRMARHPADQFEAFKSLADEGRGTEDIAARFGVTPTLVRQRLKLACVRPQVHANLSRRPDELRPARGVQGTKVYQYRAIVQEN